MKLNSPGYFFVTDDILKVNMLQYFKTPEDGNPSPLRQHFPPIDLTMLCCHFWWLKDWRHSCLAFPYWRLYWNPVAGGRVILENATYELTPDSLILIPPNTPFSTQLNTEGDFDSAFYRDHLQGGPARGLKHVKKGGGSDIIYHFFVHFTAGSPYDDIEPQIFHFGINKQSEHLLTESLWEWDDNSPNLSHRKGFLLTALISGLLGQIPDSAWPAAPDDQRVRRAIKIIDNNLSAAHRNRDLAASANMSPNAFARLFKNKIGWSPQKYLLKRRIQKVCLMLHHTDKTIDQIAVECGFCDRHYLSRIFKREIKIPPAAYRALHHSALAERPLTP
ncbi:MAG: AraC family transcriptional regulator [Lentisphaeria bacterium]